MGPSPSTRLFGARLRLFVDIRRFVRGFDFRDALTVVALVGVFVGLAAPSLAFGVTGALLLLLTPIGDALRFLIRGK
jgi:hypothetical protein